MNSLPRRVTTASMAPAGIPTSTLIMEETLGATVSLALASLKGDNSPHQEEEELIPPMSLLRENLCITLEMVLAETPILCKK